MEFIEETLTSNIQLTLSDDSRKNIVSDLLLKVETTYELVHDYPCIKISGYDTDDEIVNWTFGDVKADFFSSISSLVIGQYKASASLVRNAFELAALALSFQLNANEEKEKGIELTPSFRDWDRGQLDTPNWGSTKKILNRCENLKKFERDNRINLVEDSHIFFKELCEYTHNRPFGKNSSPILIINNGQDYLQGFESKLFNRITPLISEAISKIVSLWVVAFPEIYFVESNWCKIVEKFSKLEWLVGREHFYLLQTFIECQDRKS